MNVLPAELVKGVWLLCNQEYKPFFSVCFRNIIKNISIFLKKLIYLFDEHWGFACMYIHRSMRPSEPMELESQIAVNCHVSDGN